jgi:hypothetical protein
MTLSIMTLRTMTLSIMTLKITTLSIMTVSITTLSTMTVSITTLSKTTLNKTGILATIRIYDNQHKLFSASQTREFEVPPFGFFVIKTDIRTLEPFLVYIK